MRNRHLLLALFAGAVAGTTQAATTITLHEATDEGPGDSVGTVTVTESEYGLVFTPDLKDLDEGIHGFHVHQNPTCQPGEKDGDTVPASENPREVLIVGGGPAGLEAARVAGERGHKVRLVERSAELGGQFRLAAGQPERGEVGQYLNWAINQLEKLQVKVDLRTEVSAEDIAGDTADAVVLYFTMWCPICLAHSDHMFNNVIPQFSQRGDVVYLMVDYVSGSVVTSRAAETANGYAGSEFVTVVDTDRSVMGLFNTAMGSVVVMGADGVILVNEDYRSGDATMDALDGYLP